MGLTREGRTRSKCHMTLITLFTCHSTINTCGQSGDVALLVQCGGSSLASRTLKNVASLTAKNNSLTLATHFSVYYTPEAPDIPCPREGE